MNRRILLPLFIAFAVATSASDIYAGAFRWRCPRRPACAEPVKPTAGQRERAGTWSVLPLRSSDYGKWPPYYYGPGR